MEQVDAAKKYRTKSLFSRLGDGVIRMLPFCDPEPVIPANIQVDSSSAVQSRGQREILASIGNARSDQTITITVR